MQLTQTQQSLVTENMKLVYSAILPFCRKIPRLADEFESAGFYALTNAAANFNPEFGTQFSTYAVHSIKRVCINVLRRGNYAVCTPNGKELVKVANASELVLESIPERQSNTELLEEVAEVVSKLPERNKVVYSGLLAGDTMETIGNRMNISKQRVEQLKRETLELIRKQMGV